jgi:hypothetical protein
MKSARVSAWTPGGQVEVKVKVERGSPKRQVEVKVEVEFIESSLTLALT